MRAALAASVITVSLVAGCSRSTDGTVAMTTEPGPPLTTSAPPTGRLPSTLPTIPGLPEITIPNIPGLPGGTDTSPLPDVPAPANATTMTCSEYTKLDAATQLAVVKAILKDDNPLAILGPDVAKSVADMACPVVPQTTVSSLLATGG